MYIVLKEGVGNLFMDDLAQVLEDVAQGGVISVHTVESPGRAVQIEQVYPKDKNAPEHLTCQDCGHTGDDVERGYCPYAQEIHGEDEPVVLCPECYHQRAMDV